MSDLKHRRAFRIAGSTVVAGAMLAATLTSAVQARSAVHPAAKPAYGGTINTYNGQPDCLDPQKTGLSASYGDFTYVMDSLVILDKKGHPKGDLALSWKTAKGGTQITFFLRQGVKFSNGDPFTATDVKYTFDRAVNAATKSPAAGGQLAQVASTKVVNKYTVQITLKTPFRPLFTNLGNAYTGIIDRKAVQKEGDTGFCQKPVGTGPYKITSTGTAFDTVTLEVNKYHTWEPALYRNQGKPYISKIISHYITADATIASELLSGELDLGTVPATQLTRLQGNSKIALHSLPVQGENYLGFNTSKAPWNNLQVRKAVAEAIDRGAIVKAADNGLGVAQYSPLGSKIPFYDKNAKKYMPSMNIADAQRIITANHATGPYTLLVPTSGSAGQTSAELLQAQLAAIGMTVTVQTKPIGDYLSLAGKGEFDLNYLGYGYSDPDVLYLLYDSVNGKGAGLNFTQYVNPTLDALLVKGRETLNTKKATAIYNQVQELMNKNVIVVPLDTPTSPLAVRTRIKGYYVNDLNIPLPINDYYVLGT